MARWAEFASSSPKLATAGRSRLEGQDGVAIGFLSTTGLDGSPHIAPVCPIFCGDDLYLSAGAHTPKVADLRADQRYALHAFLGPGDEEFQIAGLAAEVADSDERDRVHAAIRFGAFDRSDPIFRFDVVRVLWVAWENVGKPGTRPIRRRWRAPS